MYFKTKIYHPNIDESGQICQNVYESNWKPTKKVRSIIQLLRSMLMDPDPESALRIEVASEFTDNFKEYEKKAKEMTAKYAA